MRLCIKFQLPCLRKQPEVCALLSRGCGGGEGASLQGRDFLKRGINPILPTQEKKDKYVSYLGVRHETQKEQRA